MSRKPRDIHEGEYYHVLTRGNNRQWLFRKEEDFAFYLRTLQRYSQKFNVSVFHYCLMTNHIHLLMKSEILDEGITRLMHGLQTVYAAYYKRKQGTTGHVFENRFKHFHIEDDAYLLECGRYIERNPVRAGIVQRAEDYAWSSFRYYAESVPDTIVTPDPLYTELGRTERERQDEYRKYVETPRPYEKILDKYFDERVLI